MNGRSECWLVSQESWLTYLFICWELCSESFWPWAGGFWPLLQRSGAALRINTCKCSTPRTISQMHSQPRESGKEKKKIYFHLFGQMESRRNARAVDHLQQILYQLLFLLGFRERCTWFSTFGFLFQLHIPKIVLKRIYVPWASTSKGLGKLMTLKNS